jgi:hypothetical protein
VSYNKQKLHKVGYFRELLKSNPDIDGRRRLVIDRAHNSCSSLYDVLGLVRLTKRTRTLPWAT